MLFCPNCGHNVKDTATKFCTECGFLLKANDVEQTADSTTDIHHEYVRKKSETDMERLFSRLAVGFAGYGVIHAVVSLFLWHSFTGTGFRIVLLMFVLAFGCFIISKMILKSNPVIEHIKFKCPRCNEENIVPADIDKTFECKKCEKKFVVVENNIKTID